MRLWAAAAIAVCSAIAIGAAHRANAELPAAASRSFSREGLDRVGDYVLVEDGKLALADPVDDMFAIFMVQTPSQRGRIQPALKTLIYRAMGR